MNDMLFIVTWDESNSHSDTIATVLLGATVRPGAETFAALDHYSLLRMASFCCSVPRAQPISGIWK